MYQVEEPEGAVLGCELSKYRIKMYRDYSEVL